MATKTTRWSPDTCNCVLDYTWDDSVPNDQIIHTYKNVINSCSVHSALTGNGKKDNYDCVFEENKRKNFTYFEMLDKAFADFGDLDANGNVIFHKSLTITYNFSGTAPNRVLNVNCSGKVFTPQRITQIQTFLTNRFGAGKVVFTNTQTS